LEAAACEKPVIASRVGGLPEVVRDGITGLLVDATRVEDLAEAIATLYQCPDLRRTMGVAGRALVAGTYSWERSVSKMISLYESTLGAGSWEVA
jgi:glycosyltransferase involved in cell wall biosynthesis